ncbi:hypothetical protein M2271_003582 [Streptomyces sp. LBL]|uniref:hypothetical protein n=1 Tax=Streptomyces sp. LBL TaxID=2940562 RepID=UPI002476027A|nr:hypothetical protein [Streptomyces sp. LBL]MDH6625771.1 hypothetical protein [Streptomyces sp. LBL]
MGVFDGGTYCVTVYRKGDEDGQDEHTDDPRTLVESLRSDPEVRAVETHAIHYVTGAYQCDFSFGNPDEEDED